eukprot:jgi/Tetstr1/433123/TSEL_022455.t1
MLRPSRRPTGIKATAKQLYWEAYIIGRNILRGKPMPLGWSDHAWDSFIIFGPLPGGKNAPDFIGFNDFSSHGRAAAQSSRAANREMSSCRKKARRDEERKQAAKDVVERHSQSISKQPAATADALNMNNATWEIELMVKHGNEQQKAKALELLAKNMEEAMPTPP